jgi:hypothetical protein
MRTRAEERKIQGFGYKRIQLDYTFHSLLNSSPPSFAFACTVAIAGDQSNISNQDIGIQT